MITRCDLRAFLLSRDVGITQIVISMTTVGTNDRHVNRLGANTIFTHVMVLHE